jgi:hypothetical protein
MRYFTLFLHNLSDRQEVTKAVVGIIYVHIASHLASNTKNASLPRQHYDMFRLHPLYKYMKLVLATMI